MADEEKNLPEESSEKQEKPKGAWQEKKEGWYDKIPLTVKQLDIIIAVCWILLALTVVAMYLDTKGIVNIF